MDTMVEPRTPIDGYVDGHTASYANCCADDCVIGWNDGCTADFGN